MYTTKSNLKEKEVFRLSEISLNANFTSSFVITRKENGWNHEKIIVLCPFYTESGEGDAVNVYESMANDDRFELVHTIDSSWRLEFYDNDLMSSLHNFKSANKNIRFNENYIFEDEGDIESFGSLFSYV